MRVFDALDYAFHVLLIEFLQIFRHLLVKQVAARKAKVASVNEESVLQSKLNRFTNFNWPVNTFALALLVFKLVIEVVEVERLV